MSDQYEEDLSPEELLLLHQQETGDAPATSGVGPVADPAEYAQSVDASAPAAPDPQGPKSDDDILRAGLLKQMQKSTGNQDALQRAEDTAQQNTFMARIGQSAANLGNSIARSPTPLNQQPFEDLAADAQQPLKAIERRQSLATNQDKILRDYLLKDALIKGQNSRTDKRVALGEKSLGVRKDIADQTAGNYKERTGVLKDTANSRLALAGQSLGLRVGAQAMKVAKEFKDDKVMMATSQQQQMIQKALGQLAEAKKYQASGGKEGVPFTSQLKHDIEADLAKAFGMGSSLGAQDSVTFSPYQEKWKKLQSNIGGVSLDLGLPEYQKQLENNLNVFNQDLEKIQNTRRQSIGKGFKTAVSGNALASKTLEENSAPTKEAEMKPPVTQNGHTYHWNAEKKKYE